MTFHSNSQSKKASVCRSSNCFCNVYEQPLPLEQPCSQLPFNRDQFPLYQVDHGLDLT